jgi:hypothetical protein
MKLVAAAIAVGVLALAALALRELDVWGEDSVEGGIERPSIELGTERAADQPPGDLERSGSACQRLAALAAGLGLRESTPAGFLRALGQAAAGIRPPPRALSDLARGGRDLIPGGGFWARYSDGSGGAAATMVISVVFRRDPVRSADGRLSERALDFATLVSSGELPLEQTGTWILENLCRPAALGGPGDG